LTNARRLHVDASSREIASGESIAMHELTSIAFSHYVEKARWALDRFAVPYVDRRYLPLFHFAGVFKAHRGTRGRADKASSRFSTPVLKTPDGDVLCDSAEIVRYVSDRFAAPGERLYDLPEAAEIERQLHDDLGPHTRRVAYGALFADPSLLRDIARRNVDRVQSRSFSVVLPFVVQSMRKVLDVNDASVARSLQTARREMDAISARLSDGRPYLVGDRFSAADLAFACMAAPSVFPAEYSAWLPPLERLPSEARALVEEMRQTPAGQYALRMFREERRRVLGSSKARVEP
jgi:glutathione S-transferase